jgi:hypothetical protein
VSEGKRYILKDKENDAFVANKMINAEDIGQKHNSSASKYDDEFSVR